MDNSCKSQSWYVNVVILKNEVMAFISCFRLIVRCIIIIIFPQEKISHFTYI